jgi:hypothetical protein
MTIMSQLGIHIHIILFYSFLPSSVYFIPFSFTFLFFLQGGQRCGIGSWTAGEMADTRRSGRESHPVEDGRGVWKNGATLS